jgi:glycosyltransferase involved in cell wall biosynthesis
MPNKSFPFAVCTIIASNYLSRALVMHDSLKAQHPEMDFWLLVIDDMPLAPQSSEAVKRRGIHTLRTEEIGLPPVEIANFRMAYDLTEISTAFKPWTLETVIKQTGLHVIYIDPDIEFFGPMTSLVEAVHTHDLVLTPHVLQPMKRDDAQPSEADIMGSGIYNLGFVGLNRNAAHILEWWEERLKRDAYNAPAEQRFTDQRWMDFAPSLFDCFISKDETFNVAYWNVDNRPVELDNGKFLIRGKPLSFFHFSGLDEKTPHMLTAHHTGRPRVLLSEHPALATLTEHYIRSVQLAKKECADDLTAYAFNEYPKGGKISAVLRRVFLKELMQAEKEKTPPPPSPFGAEGEQTFSSWLMEPQVVQETGVSIPRLALILLNHRPDLVRAFPNPTGSDAASLVEWFMRDGVSQCELPSRFVPAPSTPRRNSESQNLVPGLEILGYLRTESGVGEAARLLTLGLENSSIPISTHVDTTATSRQQDPFVPRRATDCKMRDTYDCCVLCVNADSVASVRNRLGRAYFDGRRVVGLWFWELEMFPEHLYPAFAEVDEIWVASEFIRKTLAKVSPVPVHLIPLPFGVAKPTGPLDRTALGIPAGSFFLFSFDFHSVFRRKNPLAVIEAFKLAFPEGEGPTLVIKGINGNAHIADLEQLRHAARDRRDIVILSCYLDAATNQALTAACDCYVSLHRSEGLGLTMAEAMLRQKPVIATAYSGNMDFMNDGNSYLCRYQMTAVGPEAHPYPHEASWAEPDIHHAAELMQHVYFNKDEAAKKGTIAATEIAAKFNPARCASAVESRLQALRAPMPEVNLEDGMNENKPSSSSASFESLRKEIDHPLDVDAAVPSLGSLIFQGPRRILIKVLRKIEGHRKPFDEAVVHVASEHEKRLAQLEKSIEELRQQNASLIKEARTTGKKST